MAKRKFNRSTFMRARHKEARRQRAFFSELSDDETKYSDFLSAESPLEKKIVSYDVSYQVSYKSASNEINIKSPSTFRVYAIGGMNTEDKIFQGTVDAVQNVRGAGTNKKFNSAAQDTIGRNIDVDMNRVDKPRGMEQVDDPKITREIIDGLKGNQGFFVEGKDQVVEVKGKKSSAKMNVDITRYI